MPKPAPTHRVKHYQLGEANIRLAPSLQEQLKSRSESVRNRARDSVCIQFRKACKAKAGASWNWVEGQPFLDWGDLAIQELPRPEAAATPTPIKTQPESTGSCCDDDDCVNCDIGYHERCPNCNRLG